VDMEKPLFQDFGDGENGQPWLTKPDWWAPKRKRTLLSLNVDEPLTASTPIRRRLSFGPDESPASPDGDDC